MNWFDILVLVIFALYSIKGWKQGFILSFFNLIGTIGAAVAAKLYHPVVSKYIFEHPVFFVKLQEWIGWKVKDAAYQEVAARGDIASDNIFQILKMPVDIQKILMGSEKLQEYSTKAMEGVSSYIADTLTRMFINVVSILLIFFCVRVACTLVAHVLNGLFSLPILHQFNHGGGLILGGIKGLVIIFVLLLAMIPLHAMIGQGFLTEGLEASIIAKYLYDHNVLLGMLGSVF
ncbi:MAG: CvpA family protein [Thermotaleaceae bacterium]